MEEGKQRPSKNKIFAHIQKELETKNNAKPAKLNESEQVGGSWWDRSLWHPLMSRSVSWTSSATPPWSLAAGTSRLMWPARGRGSGEAETMFPNVSLPDCRGRRTLPMSRTT